MAPFSVRASAAVRAPAASPHVYRHAAPFFRYFLRWLPVAAPAPHPCLALRASIW